eukprot:gene6146-2382_t
MSEADVIRSVQELVHSGYSVDTEIGSRAKTWLVVAALYNYKHAIELIAQYGGDLDRQDCGGRTPMVLVAASRHRDGLRYMLTPSALLRSATKAAPTATSTSTSTTPAQQAAAMATLLARLGADVNLADEGGRSPTWMAAHDDAVEVLKVLAVYGADLSAVDADGFSPLETAADMLNHDSVSFLCWARAWSPLRIGLACNMPDDLTWTLRNGFMDPDEAGVEELLQTRNATFCLKCKLNTKLCNPKIQKLCQDATNGWSWRTHWLHHGGVRTTVKTTLLVAQRLRDTEKTHAQKTLLAMSSVSTASSAKATAAGQSIATLATTVRNQKLASLPALRMPTEMWHVIMGFFLRSHWPVRIDSI